MVIPIPVKIQGPSITALRYNSVIYILRSDGFIDSDLYQFPHVRRANVCSDKC